MLQRLQLNARRQEEPQAPLRPTALRGAIDGRYTVEFAGA